MNCERGGTDPKTIIPMQAYEFRDRKRKRLPLTEF
jgi:hypothetical protein